ncbi:hypothetical protein K2X30_02845 [bacterium]|jgi:hypothetical protein|nr:hypothetical protein [bacterium]
MRTLIMMLLTMATTLNVWAFGKARPQDAKAKEHSFPIQSIVGEYVADPQNSESCPGPERLRVEVKDFHRLNYEGPYYNLSLAFVEPSRRNATPTFLIEFIDQGTQYLEGMNLRSYTRANSIIREQIVGTGKRQTRNTDFLDFSPGKMVLESYLNHDLSRKCVYNSATLAR